MPGIHFREVVCMLGIFGLFLQAAAGHILYLALHLESGSFPRPLPPDRERAAFADLQKGGAVAAQARDTLIRHNLRLVAHICKKYYAGNSAQDDMISIGTIGLIKGISTFDPKKGARLATYAARCVENAMHPPGRHFPLRSAKRDRCASSDPVFVLAAQHNCSFGLRRIFFTDLSV